MTAAVVALGLIGSSCGGSEEDGVRTAIRELTEAAQRKDAAGVCQLLFSNVFLPRAVAREARVPEGSPGTPADFETSQAECAKEMGKGGEFEALREEPRLSNIKIRKIKPTQEITALATAEPEELHFIKYRDKWRVLFITN